LTEFDYDNGVRRPDKTATSTTMPKGKYTESLTFSTPNCIYANYGKLGKPSLQMVLQRIKVFPVFPEDGIIFQP
jgi:hypothetical protein